MESRVFIAAARALITKIEDGANTIGTSSQLQDHREEVQKEVTQLFGGLMNPTLPSAFVLRNTAMRNGFHVSPMVLNRLAQFD